jgi:chromosome segregation ATPase
MTIEEMFQMLMNEVKEMRGDMVRLETNQTRIEAKVDSNHKDVIADVARLENKLDVIATDVAEIKEDVHLLNKLDEIDSLSINAAFVDIKEIKEKVNNLDKQSNIVRALDKSVPSLQVRLSDLEDEVAQIKKHLDKAS